MQTIQVITWPHREFINDLAKVFHIQNVVDQGACVLQIPPHLGTGKISVLCLDGGINVVEYECAFKEEHIFQFIAPQGHPLKLMHVLAGNLSHCFEDGQQLRTVRQYQNVMVLGKQSNAHIIYFKKGVKHHFFNIEVDRFQFMKKPWFQGIEIPEKLTPLFDTAPFEKSLCYQGQYSLQMVDTIKKRKKFTGSNFLYYLLMEEIAYRTLFDWFSEYVNMHRPQNFAPPLRAADIDKIAQASEYISENLYSYRSIACLRQLTGLNANKLQIGFKFLYNKTVNEYVYEQRLRKAKELLLTTDLTISEIVYRIGLSSKSYFSRLFKDEYEISPSEYRAGQRSMKMP